MANNVQIIKFSLSFSCFLSISFYLLSPLLYVLYWNSVNKYFQYYYATIRPT